MRMRREQGKRKTYGGPQRWTPRADRSRSRPQRERSEDLPSAENRAPHTALPVSLASRGHAEQKESAPWQERAAVGRDERRGQRPGAQGARRSPYGDRAPYPAYGERPRGAYAYGDEAAGAGPRYGADPRSAYGGHAADAFPGADAGYEGEGAAPYGEDPTASRILPDVPRRPHRYTRPDLGPVPGSHPHRARRGRGPGHGRRLMFAGPARQRRSLGQLALVAVVAIAVVFGGANLVMGYFDGRRRAEEEAAEAAAQAAYEQEQEEMLQSFSPANADLSAIPAAQDGVEKFSLSGADAEGLSDRTSEALQKAIAPVEELGPVGFTLINLETGFGLAYNVDQAVYGASSFKAPYATYICQELVDGGDLTLDSACPVGGNIDASGYYGNTGDDSYPLRELISAAVVESDNNAFIILRAAYDEQGFDAWIQGLGVEDAAHAEGNFPTYCARSAAKLWLNTYAYFSTGSETARWLEEQCGQTATSFLRDGITDKIAHVYDKAGWYTSDDEQYRCVSDAGLIEDADDTTYLMAIMTGMSYDDEASEAFGTLADTLFAARTELAAS